MAIHQHHTWKEIQSQPEAWTEALKVITEARRSVLDLDPARRYGQILFTGCGSTYYLALAAAALTQELTGLPSRAFPASELWLYPASCYCRAESPTYRTTSPTDRAESPTYKAESPACKTLLVAVSRSGETTETLRACQAFLEDRRGDLATLSCYGETPLAKMGALNLVLPSGQEQSVAQTRAFSTLYLGAVALAALWAGRGDLFTALNRLPAAGRSVIERTLPLAADLGRDLSIDRFYWLGSGPRYGLAAELSLKMKEMSLSHSEPFHFLEFRHGPKSMAAASALVVGLRSTVTGPHEAAVLADVRALGGRVLDIAETGATVCLESGLDEAVRSVLYLPVGQVVAFERALAKGLNPDRPTNLSAVVTLE